MAGNLRHTDPCIKGTMPLICESGAQLLLKRQGDRSIYSLSKIATDLFKCLITNLYFSSFICYVSFSAWISMILHGLKTIENY